VVYELPDHQTSEGLYIKMCGICYPEKTEKLLSGINNNSFYCVIFLSKKAKARDKKGMAKRRDRCQ
jgi:hypothetical protein